MLRANDGTRTGGEILVDQLLVHGVEHVFKEFPSFDQGFTVRCIAKLFAMDFYQPLSCFLLRVFVHRVVVPTRHLVESTGGINDDMEERQSATELLRQFPGVL